MKCLVVGGTGTLGCILALRLKARGYTVRSTSRPTSDPGRIAQLKKAGIDLVTADLTDPASLRAACKGMDGVVSTASAMLSSNPHDDIAHVDIEGQLALMAATQDSKVARFVYVSFAPMESDFPLQRAKRLVESELACSGLDFTIVQPTYFRELWLSQFLGFEPAGRKALIYGSGDHKVTLNALDEVVDLVTSVVANEDAIGRTVQLGGLESVTQLEIVRMAEEIFGHPIAVEHLREEAIEAALNDGRNDIEQSRAGLLLGYARGNRIDNQTALSLAQLELSSVRRHLQNLASST